MRQCRLEKPIESGGQRMMVTWLPEKFAKVNDIVKLKNEDDEWIDGWKIVTVGDTRITYEDSNKQSQAHKSMATYGGKKNKDYRKENGRFEKAGE